MFIHVTNVSHKDFNVLVEQFPELEGSEYLAPEMCGAVYGDDEILQEFIDACEAIDQDYEKVED